MLHKLLRSLQHWKIQPGNHSRIKSQKEKNMWLTGKNLWLTGDQYSEKMAKAVQLSLWYGSYCKMPYLLFGPSKANARKISCLTFEVKNAAPNLISAVIHLRTHQATPFSQLGNGIFNYFSPRHSILSHATFLNVQRPLNL